MRQKEEEARQKESELVELKAFQRAIKGELTSVRGRLREVVGKASSVLRGAQVAKPRLLASAASSALARSASVANASPVVINLGAPLSFEKSLPSVPQQPAHPVLQAPKILRPSLVKVGDGVGGATASNVKRRRFERGASVLIALI